MGDAPHASARKKLERPIFLRANHQPRGAFSGRKPGTHDRLDHVQPAVQRWQLVQHRVVGTHTIATKTMPFSIAILFESLVRFRTRNQAWTRIENADRTNELLVGENPLPPGFAELPIGHVQAYTFGYDRDFNLIPDLESALGAQITTYGVPSVLTPIYGSHPSAPPSSSGCAPSPQSTTRAKKLRSPPHVREE